MKTKATKSKVSFPLIGLVTAGILLIPLIAMQFSDGWNWDLSDFIIIGILLFVTGTILNLINLKVRDKTHRIMLAIGVLLLFLYVYAELAVGIFTNLGS